MTTPALVPSPSRRLACAALLLLGLVASPASAQEPAAGQNLYRAGPSVSLDAPVRGDLLAAGGRIQIDHAVGRDAAVAGGDVALRADIGEDLRAVGGQVVLDARVGGDAHIAGGRVELGRNAAIAGGAWLAGGSLELAGRLPARTRVHAGQVVLSGEVDGDLFVQAESLQLAPTARVRGTLTYAGRRELVADPAAQVGAVVRQPMTPRPAPRHDEAPGALQGMMMLLGLMAAGVVWTLLFPSLARDAQARLARMPGPSVAVGAAVVLAAPLLIVVLLVTIVGAPLALALMAAYGLLLLAGYLVVAGALGDRLLQALGKGATPTAGRRLAALAAALLMLGLLAALPVLGWVLTLLVVMAGAGALVGHWRSRATPAAA